MRKGLSVAAGMAVGLGFLWLALRGIDAAAVRSAMAQASPVWLAAAVAALAAGYAARILRWRELLLASRPGVTAAACAGPLLAGFALNNILPLRAGDFARAFAFRERLGVPGPEVLGSLVAERLLDLGALVAAFALGMAALGGALVPPAAVWAAEGAGLLCFVAFAAWLATPSRVWQRFRGKGGVAGVAGRVVGALEILRAPRRLWRLIALSLAAWSFEAVLFMAVARALGLALPPAAAPAILGAATLATMIPGTPGHVGTFDFFARQSVVALGVPVDTAIAYAFLVHFVLWAPITLAGLVALLVNGIGLREAVRKGREAGAA